MVCVCSSSRRAGPSRLTAVLMHGFMGDRRDMEPFRLAISAAGSVDTITMDLPGHGDTARLAQSDNEVEPAVDAVWTAIDEFAVRGQPLLLVGYSLGGRIALQLAEQLVSKKRIGFTVAGMVLLSSNPGIKDETERASRYARDVYLAARLREMTPAQFCCWLDQEWYSASIWGGLRSNSKFEETLARRTDGVRPAARAASLEQESVGKQESLWTWLSNTDTPVLMLAGQDDMAYTQIVLHLCKDLVDERADCTIVPRQLAGPRGGLIKQAAHAVLIEAPERVTALCVAFAASLAIPRTLESDGCSTPSGGVRIVFTPKLIPFRLALSAPLPLSRGDPLTAREGYLLLISGYPDGGYQHMIHGVGELCPLPCFHSETCEEARAQLFQFANSLVGRVVPYSLIKLRGGLLNWMNDPSLYPSVRCAVECALLHLLTRSHVDGAHGTPRNLARALAENGFGRTASDPCISAVQSHVRVNGLLTRAEAEQAMLASSEEVGGNASDVARYRTWKLKVGGACPEEEGTRVGRLVRGCEALGIRLRLDANQAWTQEAAQRFCSALKEEYNRCVALTRGPAKKGGPFMALEFCEEPLQGSLLRELSELYLAEGLNYALDESVVPVAHEVCRLMHHQYAHGKAIAPKLEHLRAQLSEPGCASLILKPTLLGGFEVTAALAAEAAMKTVPVVLTSAFESGVSHSFVAVMASALGAPSFAHGLSTFERLATDALTPPFSQAVVGGDLVDLERVLQALDTTADALASRSETR